MASDVKTNRASIARQTQIALLRGINVGKAKRIAMADLRAIVQGLGFTDVRTLLNSGNVVYSSDGVAPGHAGARIEQAVARRLGVSSRVIVFTARELMAVVERNPLTALCNDPSRMFVAFLARAADGKKLEPLLGRDWEPEGLAIGPRVAWLWCPRGMMESRLFEPAMKALGDAVTVRNWTTVTKLHAAAFAGPALARGGS